MHYDPEFVPPSPGMTEECVEFVCTNETTGTYAWIALSLGMPCTIDEDPCDRFVCNGKGYCAVSPNSSWTCFSPVFSSLDSAFVFVLVLFLLSVLGIVILGIVIWCMRGLTHRARLPRRSIALAEEESSGGGGV